MTVRIYDSLLNLADDEGLATATKTAQRWQSALEEMTECGSREEQDAARLLLNGVNSALRKLASERGAKR